MVIYYKMVPSEPCLCELKPCIVFPHIYLARPYDLFDVIECNENGVV